MNVTGLSKLFPHQHGLGQLFHLFEADLEPSRGQRHGVGKGSEGSGRDLGADQGADLPARDRGALVVGPLHVRWDTVASWTPLRNLAGATRSAILTVPKGTDGEQLGGASGRRGAAAQTGSRGRAGRSGSEGSSRPSRGSHGGREAKGWGAP